MALNRVSHKKTLEVTQAQSSTQFICYGSGFVICIRAVQRSQPGAQPHPLQAVQLHSETSLEQRACRIYARHQ